MVKETINYSTEEGQEEFNNKDKEEKGKIIESSQEEANILNDIKDYEKRNGVDQDTIAKSYLAHADIYKSLSDELKEVMDRFYTSEKSNGPDHSFTKEAKLDWDIVQAKLDDKASVMNSMLGNLTPETLDRYKEDFRIRGVINENF